MAPPLNHLLRSPSLSTCHRHRHRRCSKAQMCFFNILHIISVFPAADVTEKKCFDREIKGLGGDEIDVNLRLPPPTEVEPFQTDGFRENCVKSTNDRSKTGSFAAEAEESEAERATEHSEISHVGDQSSGIDYNDEEDEEEKQRRDEGCLGLLIEAAQLIQEEEEECRNPSEPPASKQPSTTAIRGAKRKRQCCWTAATEAEWYAEFEDTSPVVKSKRGRSQVLPYKYRDSVVEPLVGWTSTATHHHRSIGNSAAAVPSKRRRSK